MYIAFLVLSAALVGSLALLQGSKSRAVLAAASYAITIGIYLYAFTPSIGFYRAGVAVPFLVAIATLALVNERRFNGAWLCGFGFLAWFLLVQVSSTAMFHASAQRAVLGGVDMDGIFDAVDAPLDPAMARVVDEGVALRLADKRLGEQPALGSIVRLGQPIIQRLDDGLYWIVPLEHSGFFRWWANRSGTPGYVKVNATNERDVVLVTEDRLGNPVMLRHNLGAWFGDNPWRVIRRAVGAEYVIVDLTIEVEDGTGKPFMVASLSKPRVGVVANDVVAVAVLDMASGGVEVVSGEAVPAWIDRVHPESYVRDQLRAWGRYVRGWWNPSGLDVLKPTDLMEVVYGRDGVSYWYTGLTSSGTDDASVGFVLVNTRTKKVTFYAQPGATETAARQSAEGAVQEKGYVATAPILYSVGSRPTYFLALKDDAGLVKSFAFVDLESYSIVGIGPSVEEALRSFRRAVASRGNTATASGSDRNVDVIGVVRRFAADIRAGDTYYYIQIRGHDDIIFVGSSTLSGEMPLTIAGDSVRLRYDDAGQSVNDLSFFDNLAIAPRTGDAEGRRREAFDDAQIQADTLRQEKNADAQWDQLSAEEKAHLLRREPGQ